MLRFFRFLFGARQREQAVFNPAFKRVEFFLARRVVPA